jgi:hypothetical protein
MQSAKTSLAAGLLSMAACVTGAGASAAPVTGNGEGSGAAQAQPQRDGARDFDWEIGRWRTRVRLLAKPLSGSQEWLEYEGTSDVRALLDGRANLVELRVAGPSGRIEGLSLRLYEPQARQWSLNYANIRNGLLTQPVHGSFHDGRGEFYGQERVDGRAVLVRFVIARPAPDTARFEQAFSGDGGLTWESNWIATDTRIGPE